ncbi:MAG: F0F1 ATP synthase subunit B [Pseudomonadota bacterium]
MADAPSSTSTLKTVGGFQPTASVGAKPGESAAFPPFNVETFAPQLIWLAISFTLLYLLMSRVALPRIEQVLSARRERIRRDLDEAERLRGETDKALADYEKTLADARSKASATAAQTREQVAGEADKERHRVEEDLAAKLATAEARITETKAAALASVDEIATDTATSIVKQLVGTDVSPEDVRKALQQAS